MIKLSIAPPPQNLFSYPAPWPLQVVSYEVLVAILVGVSVSRISPRALSFVWWCVCTQTEFRLSLISFYLLTIQFNPASLEPNSLLACFLFISVLVYLA